ncbi:hypothetical protein L2725_00120 [Shewanella corallii]|uniref:Lipoprotein n=1 Tax=Shewanella corallii TaxID=560080 RepID=A0ABT0N2T1_9GAMM|nr:hypothetical protein [Shewanella corallii]MCL2912196.1 hypothetical protein [Shewanella corallii]
MKKLIIGFLAVIGLSGCVTPIPLKEQIPSPEYKATQPVLISVVDKRNRVQEGKPANFVGVAHGAFGIPVDWNVDILLATEKDDKSLTLAQWLQKRLVKGLQEKGWSVKGVDLNSVPTSEQAEITLTQNQATQLLTLELQEWYFSINLNWVTAFNFDTDAHLYLFEKGQGQVYYKQTKERDVIDEQASESPQNNVLRAYRDQLQQLLSDPELKAAIIKAQTTATVSEAL